MFIELTDLLRCPAEHDEAYLVLLPATVEARSVVIGELGCPVCGRTFAISEGEARFADGPVAGPVPTGLDAEGVLALLGLEGPGGYVALVGGTARLAPEVSHRLDGVHLVTVNPPRDVTAGPGISVLRADRIPLKRATVRGVVLEDRVDGGQGEGQGRDDPWLAEAMRVVLPGLRIVGFGAAPAVEGLEVLGQAGATAWVARREPRPRPPA